MATHAASKLEKIAADMPGLRHKAQQRLARARAAGEPFWEKLYAQWLGLPSATNPATCVEDLS